MIARRITADRGRPGSDDLDARLLRDHVLRAEEVRVRPDPEDDRRAPRPHPLSRSRRPSNARDEARRLLEEHKQLIGQAKSEAGEILAEARKVADSQRERAREEIEADRQRRLEETRKQIEAETVRALEQIRSEVAELTLDRDARR